MRLNIEDYLHQIDSAFKYKTQKDIYMTYIIIFGLIFAFAYLLFWESSLQEYETKQKEISSLDSKIMADKIYLKVNPQAKITQLETHIREINADILVKKDDNAYIKTQIEAISSLIYDERAWGEYLYSISTNAKKYNVTILNFTNKFATDERSFGHMLDISVKSTGKYHDTIKFINSLEQSNLVVDIHQLNLEAKDTLHSDLNISVWGITY